MFNYVGSTNPNLTCCICRAPFVEPTTSTVCSHTFCLECIIQCITILPYCPVDRRPLQAENLVPSNPIIRHLVDELPVYCANSSSGCSYTCERQFLQGHTSRACLYSLISCPKGGCDKKFLRKDEIQHACNPLSNSGSSESTHTQATVEQDHSNSSFGGNIACLLCNERFPVNESGLHDSFCPVAPVSCEQSANGCTWMGPREDVDDHLSSCPYHAIKGFFDIEKRKYDVLLAENDVLRSQNESVLHAQQTIYRDLALIRSAIGPWFHNVPDSSPPTAHQIPDPHDSQAEFSTLERMTPTSTDQTGLDSNFPNMRVADFPLGVSYSTNSCPMSQIADSSTSFRPAIPPPLDSAKSIYENFCDLHTAVTALSSNLASLARLQNQSLNAETFRLNDELASLRVILHGIRLQMNSVLMERNLQLAGGNESAQSTFILSEHGQPPFRSHTSLKFNPGTKL